MPIRAVRTRVYPPRLGVKADKTNRVRLHEPTFTFAVLVRSSCREVSQHLGPGGEGVCEAGDLRLVNPMCAGDVFPAGD